MTRRELLAAATFVPAARAAASRPNVVVFMTDDHGAWALNSYGCPEMHTPNIDSLARAGTRFTRAFACTPVCSPSRMTYMTGELPSHHGVQDWLVPVDSFGAKSRRYLEGHTAWSEVLAKNGYTLGMSGKWHMGHDERPQAGFTYWATIPGGGGPYRNVEILRNGVREKAAFKTDAFADCAVEFLGQQKGRGPFCLLMPFYAPHTPLDYQPDEDRAPYSSAKFSCFPDLPVHPWQNAGLRRHHGNRESKLGYSALISGADRAVGRVLRKLEEIGARENTLVIFTADQGFNCGHHGVWGKGNGTVPYNMYDESIRVPLIWNHAGRIRPGRELSQMVSSYDFFPTLLDYLGLRAPADRRRVGRSYAALLRGQSPRWQNRLYFEYGYTRAVRTENLKYIERTEGWPSELFDLERDPGETANRLEDPGYAKQAQSLREDLAGWFARSGAPPLKDWHSTTTQNLTRYRRAER